VGCDHGAPTRSPLHRNAGSRPALPEEVAATPPGFRAVVRDVVYEWPALIEALVLLPTC
jgi:hypothetical protein